MAEITLRAPEPDDLDLMLGIENDTTIWEHSCVNTGPYSRFQLKRYIEENTNDIYADRQLRFVIEISDGCVAGMIDIFDFDPRNGRAEIGIFVFPHYRSGHVASSAMAEVERHCFDFLGMKQLYAYVRKDNTAACGLFRRCGFTESGVLGSWIRTGRKFHDVVIYQKISG